MRRAQTLRERLVAVREEGDRGFTLTEVLIAMMVFSLIIALSAVAVTQLARAATDASVRSQSSTNVLLAFQTLDRQVRYSSAINYPGVGTGGASYVEFRTLAASSPTGQDLCTQWRYLPTTGILQMRQWRDTPSPALPAWTTKASLVATPASTTYPFQLYPATASGNTTQSLHLVLEAGGARAEGRTEVDTILVARNSSLASASNPDANGDGQSDTPVCRPVGSRP